MEWAILGLVIALIIVFSWAFVETVDNKELRSAAIERGFAEHNSKTGKWEWKETK